MRKKHNQWRDIIVASFTTKLQMQQLLRALSALYNANTTASRRLK